VEKEPESVALHYLLGISYLDAGRKEDARAHLRIALELKPRDRFVLDALARASV